MIFIQAGMALLLLLLGFLIKNKKMYDLLSGYNSRNDEDKQKLLERGYPQAQANLILTAGIILVLGAILTLFGIPYTFEGSAILMIFTLIAGMIYLNKYEIPAKRKRNTIYSVVAAAGLLIFISTLAVYGYQENEVKISSEGLTVGGPYGDEWNDDQIESVELLRSFPEIQTKTNGFGFANRLVGHFKLTKYGNGRLYIYQNHSPYLFILLTFSFN